MIKNKNNFDFCLTKITCFDKSMTATKTWSKTTQDLHLNDSNLIQIDKMINTLSNPDMTPDKLLDLFKQAKTSNKIYGIYSTTPDKILNKLNEIRLRIIKYPGYTLQLNLSEYVDRYKSILSILIP